MIFLEWYFLLGVGTAVVTWITRFLRQRKGEAFNLPTYIALIILWPLFVVLYLWLGGEKEEENKPSILDAKPEFTITYSNLHERLSIEEIEKRELVTDPLGAVPEKPFGHLYGAWEAFKEKLTPKDTLWAFSAVRTWWTLKDLRSGYVIVREGEIGDFFIASLKPLPEEESKDTDFKDKTICSDG